MIPGNSYRKYGSQHRKHMRDIMRNALMLVYGAASSFSRTMLFKPVNILTLSGDMIALTSPIKTYTRLVIPMNDIEMPIILKRALLNSK
jgi:hypothetical protein